MSTQARTSSVNYDDAFAEDEANEPHNKRDKDGLMDHQYCLNDTLLRVPLVVRHPELVPSGLKTDALVELRDLYPTILDLCGINSTLPESVPSFPLSENGYIDEMTIGEREFVFAEYTVPQPNLDELRSRTNDEEVLASLHSLDRSLRCVRTQNWKFIHGTDGSQQLFNRKPDSDEITNVQKAHKKLLPI